MACTPSKLPKRNNIALPLRLSSERNRLVVWLKSPGRRATKIGTVSRRLGDAQRYGQDLVEDLVEAALQEADRRAVLRSLRRPEPRG